MSTAAHAPGPLVALVTGSQGGIGAATVVAFREAGWTVVGADRETGADVVADLATADGARAAIEAAAAQGRLDAVCCMHGISGRSLGDGPVETCTEAAWDAVLDANLRSVFLLCRHAVP